jgi:hypothetical protein
VNDMAVQDTGSTPAAQTASPALDGVLLMQRLLGSPGMVARLALALRWKERTGEGSMAIAGHLVNALNGSGFSRAQAVDALPALTEVVALLELFITDEEVLAALTALMEECREEFYKNLKAAATRTA